MLRRDDLSIARQAFSASPASIAWIIPMLDVVLYGYDHQGRLTLLEFPFHSLKALAHFFDSGADIPWEWAEVEFIGWDGRRRVVRYSAGSLLALLGSGIPDPSVN